jgi:hypothetical protein
MKSVQVVYPILISYFNIIHLSTFRSPKWDVRFTRLRAKFLAMFIRTALNILMNVR